MFNHYYAQREKYQNFIKDAEKERLIKQIQESQKGKNDESVQEIDRGSLASKLGFIFRDARALSSR